MRKIVFNGHEFNGQSELPVYMLNRRAFISELWKAVDIDSNNSISGKDNKNKKDSNYQNFTLLRIDVANVFSANQVADEKGRQGGDLVIQRTARAIQEAAVAFSQTRSNLQTSSNLQILTGRYGGDEFTVALVGEYTKDDINDLTAMISKQISSKQAYFQTGQNSAELKPLEVKIEHIEPPEDKNLRRLFFANLKRGVILSPEELQKEIEALQQDKKPQNDFTNYLKKLQNGSYYPKEATTAEAKLEFLKAQHPEFTQALEAALRSGINLEFLLDFIENYLADPLLNRIIITRFDLAEHLAGTFEQIIVFEVKLKEVNEEYSYSVADNLIISLWEQIKKTLGEETNKVKIGRFGGLIFIGIPEGVDQETVNKLREIKTTQANYGNKTIEMFVGFAKIDVPSDINPDNLQQTMEKIFTYPTKEWLRRNLDYIFADKNRVEKFRKLLEGEISASDDPIINILAAYFGNSRRGWPRIKNATYLPYIDPSTFLGYELPF